MEFVEISFAVVLRKDGTFFDLVDLREGEGKSKRGKIVIAPQGCDRTGQNAWATAYPANPYVPYAPQETYIRPEIGRNDPCPCGSGKKYKKCCLAKE